MVIGQAVSRPRTDEQGAGKTTHIHIQADHTGAGAQGPTHASTRPIGRVPLWAKAYGRSGRSNIEHRGTTDWHMVGLGPCVNLDDTVNSLTITERPTGFTQCNLSI